MTTNFTSKETSQKLEEVFKRHGLVVMPDTCYKVSGELYSLDEFHREDALFCETIGEIFTYRADTLLELLPKRDYQAESRKFFWEVTLEDTDEWMINFSYSHGMLNDPNLAECAAQAIFWLDENNYKFGGKDE